MTTSDDTQQTVSVDEDDDSLVLPVDATLHGDPTDYPELVQRFASLVNNTRCSDVVFLVKRTRPARTRAQTQIQTQTQTQTQTTSASQSGATVNMNVLLRSMSMDLARGSEEKMREEKHAPETATHEHVREEDVIRIYAHRPILAARSPVFAAMFYSHVRCTHT